MPKTIPKNSARGVEGRPANSERSWIRDSGSTSTVHSDSIILTFSPFKMYYTTFSIPNCNDPTSILRLVYSKVC